MEFLSAVFLSEIVAKKIRRNVDTYSITRVFKNSSLASYCYEIFFKTLSQAIQENSQ